MALYKQVNGERIKLTLKEEKDIKAEWADNDLKKESNKLSNGYKNARIKEYEKAFSLSDQIDIIQKQFQSMADKGNIVLTNESQDWIDMIELIKTNNPKPTE